MVTPPPVLQRPVGDATAVVPVPSLTGAVSETVPAPPPVEPAAPAVTANPATTPSSQTVDLSTVLELMKMVSKPEERHKLRVPEFNGKGDVDLFIEQFQEIATASRWSSTIKLIKLKEALTGPAREASRASDLEGVFLSLRKRFGLTQREARARLEHMVRTPEQSLRGYADQLARYVRQAHPRFSDEDRADLLLDKFVNSTSHQGLRGLYIAARPRDIDEAVQLGEEYLSTGKRSARDVQLVSTEGYLPDAVRTVVAPAATASVKTGVGELVGSLKKMLEELVREVKGVGQTKSDRGLPGKRLGECWTCGQKGHVRRDCPRKPSTSA